MNPIKSAKELFREVLDSACAVPGCAFPTLVHSPEYGEALAILMFEDHQHLSELAHLDRVPIGFRFGLFLVNGVGMVLIMFSIAKSRESLGQNVTELWIDHYDSRQGPEASLLSRLADGCPVWLYLFDSQGNTKKSVAIDVPPLLRQFARAARRQVLMCEQWDDQKFHNSKSCLQKKFSLESLWTQGHQMRILREEGELVPFIYDTPEPVEPPTGACGS
jgi:hypothetical protein